jgi:hypothetical protein
MVVRNKSSLSRKIGACSMAVALFVSCPANAGTSSPSFISQIMPFYAGLFFVSIGNREAAPACATSDGGRRWIINSATPQGQTMAAALLSAYALKKRITVYGTGLCDLWGDTESVSHFVIED